MNSLRVLMTADAVGGVWTYAMALSRAFQPFEIEVILAVMGTEPASSQLAEAERLQNLTVRWRPYKLEWMESPWEEVDEASG